MSLVIGTNAASLKAAHYARSTVSGMDQAMERLASGSRLNSASDDSAGVSIAAKLESQVRGLDMAMKNATHAKAALEVADGAFIEVENMLQRMRELAVQKASGTYSANDITAIEAELTALEEEIGDIATDTQFNGSAVDGANFAPADRDGVTYDMTITALGSSVTAVTKDTTVGALDTAITQVTTVRGEIGAHINQMEYRINNYSNISANTEASLSTIRDTDYAAESANLAKFQILQQAGTAMLAQANASQQSVLALLQ